MSKNSATVQDASTSHLTRDAITLTNPRLLEGPLSQQKPFDTREALVGIVVRLLNQGQFFSLRGVQAALHAVRLLQLLQREDEELRVVLVGQRAMMYIR